MTAQSIVCRSCSDKRARIANTNPPYTFRARASTSLVSGAGSGQRKNALTPGVHPDLCLSASNEFRVRKQGRDQGTTGNISFVYVLCACTHHAKAETNRQAASGTAVFGYRFTLSKSAWRESAP